LVASYITFARFKNDKQILVVSAGFLKCISSSTSRNTPLSLKTTKCHKYLKDRLYPLRLVCIRPIQLVYLLHLENKRNGEFPADKRRQNSEIFGKLTYANCLDLFSSTEV
jgi:hypothetical protein